MQIVLKDQYRSAETRKVFHVSLLMVFCLDNESDRPYLSLSPETPHNPSTTISYHSDYLHTSYKYTEEYGHEINEDLRKTALENNGFLIQTIWDIFINDCGIDMGTTAEKLASSVSWELSAGGGDVLTKILSAKFSSHFFTKCAILSDVYTNHSGVESLAEFIEYNDIGLPLAQRINDVEKMSDLSEDDGDLVSNYEYIDETWEQLCETLGVDKDGDFTSFADMKKGL